MASTVRKRATRKDVALQAGVSPAMVSFVFDPEQKHSVRAETRERILAAAKKLNYVPHFGGRSLQNCASYNIALVLPERFASAIDLFSLQIFHGICSALNATEYQPIIFFGVDKKLLRSLQSGRVDGIILLHYSAAMPDNYEQLTQFDLPVAAVGFAPALELPCFSRINLDHAKFTAAAARKIVSEKLHHLALILPGSDRLYPGSVIIDTLRKQIPSNCRLTIFDPLEPDVSDFDLRNLDSEDLRLALPAFTERLRQWHEQNDWPDGVICCNELLDSELQKFALQHDLPLPDNSHFCFDPAPSHRGQNLLSTRLGECAWQTMQAMLAGDKVKKDIFISYNS